jgi:hypothetical protein
MSANVQHACFDAKGFKALPDGIRKKFEYYWNTFETVFAFDVNVSTQKSLEKVPLTYWTYKSNEERLAYIDGRMLHIRRYPDSNWNVNRD